MPSFKVEVEGFPELVERWKGEIAHLEGELQVASWQAASDGVSAERRDHPYTDRTYDLTNTATPESDENGEADMVWPQEYASFVDEGTSRSAAYPFTPLAKDAAAKSIEAGARAAVDHIEERMK
jgi:hypothetical protein